MTYRLFIGIPPGSGLTKQLSAFRLENEDSLPSGIRFRWVPPENYHVTLLFIGNTPVKQVPLMEEQCAVIADKTSAFSLLTDRITTFPKNKSRMLWLTFRESAHFAALHRELATGITGRAPKGTVRPHITLARYRDTNFVRSWQMGREFEIGCDHFNLYRSELTPSGAVYSIIKKFQLK